MANYKLDGKKLVIVPVGSMKTTAEKLKQSLNGVLGEVKILPCEYQDYADYYTLAKEEPDYTLFLIQVNSNERLVPCVCENTVGNRERDVKESQEAIAKLKHFFRMKRNDIVVRGNYRIEYDAVKDIKTTNDRFSWYLLNEKPMVCAKVNVSEMGEDNLADALAEGIREYFVSK